VRWAGRPKRWPRVAVSGLAVVCAMSALAALTPVASASTRESLPAATIEVPRDAPTIQAAVNRATPNTLVLVARGVYRETVTVRRPDIVIRGMDRNRTILDGQFRRTDGIDVRANGVAVENLTARNFRGNGFYWERVDGYRGSYLTASRDGRYGFYAVGSQHGQLDHSYASGSADSGFYIGACNPCHAVVSDVVAAHNAIGFSGTNASGDVTVVSSRWHANGIGILPNSLDDEPLAPQAGMVIAGNQITGTPSSSTPRSLEFFALDGTGIALVGVLDDVVVKNRISSQARFGIVVTPNPGLQGQAHSSLRNQVRANVVEATPIDLVLAGASPDQGNCFEQNQFQRSAPPDLERAAPCIGTGSRDLAAGAIPVEQLFSPPKSRPRVTARATPAAPAQPGLASPATAPARPATEEPSIVVDLARVTVPPR
jgi:hypothetical protein